MLLEKAKKRDIDLICETLVPKLNKKPMFMFFCPDMRKRPEFIQSYLNYYIYEWSRYDQLLYAENSRSLISLVDPDTFAYKYKGRGARGMKKLRTSSTVFLHRENLEALIEVIIPPNKESRVMHIYANPETDLVDINALIDEAMDMARKQKFILIYDTFSKKMIGLMQKKGFTIVSQKQMLNTQFIETIMIYNM